MDTLAESPEARTALSQTHPWIRILAYAGFVTCGLMLVFALGSIAAAVVFGQMSLVPGALIYGALSPLYIYPSLCLLRQANGIRSFLETSDQQKYLASLDAQRAFWKFVGILTLVSLALLVVGVIIGVVAFAWVMATVPS